MFIKVNSVNTIGIMCQFTVPYHGDPTHLVNRAGDVIRRSGGSLRGDETSGELQVKTPLGSIAGSYEVAGQSLVIHITKKPFLVSCSRIEKELRGVLR